MIGDGAILTNVEMAIPTKTAIEPTIEDNIKE